MCVPMMETANDPDGLAEIMRHIGDPIVSPDMLAYAETVRSHYLWLYKEDKRGPRGLYCTRCQGRMPCASAPLPVTGIKHGDEITCTLCGQPAMVRECWRSHKHLMEERYVVWYRKSVVDPNVVVCVGAVFLWDYRAADPWDVRAQADPVMLCKFEYGKGGQRFMRARSWDWMPWKRWYVKTSPDYAKWKLCRECKSGYSSGGLSWTPFASDEAHARAIAGTPFARVWSKDINVWMDAVTEMALIAKYPCMEYLVKMGFAKLVKDRMDNTFARGAVNWTGKTAQRVLHMTGQQLREVRREKIELSRSYMECFKICRDYASSLSMREVAELDRVVTGYELEHFAKDNAGEWPFDKTMRYLIRQNKRAGMKLYDLTTYWSELKTLRVSPTDEQMHFPKDLREAHSKTSLRMKYLADKEVDEMIRDGLKSLEVYNFAACGLVMRPFASAKEVIDEGNRLKHCVGSYAKRYAQGQIILCAVRRAEATDTPFHTAEFTVKGNLVQCRGEGNQTKPEDKPLIDAFMAAFTERMTEKSRRKTA